MAKRVSSEIKQEYKKEIQRIQRIISKAEKEGYIFPEDVIPKLPKKATKKALEEVKAIKASDLYKAGEFVGKKSTTIPETQKETRARKTKIKTPKTKVKSSQSKAQTPRIAKEKPEPLTAEQKAKIRSEAGKKAWASRKAKMTPEQYQDYVKQQVERLQRGRKAKRKVDEYYPTKSAIEEVSHKIIELERGFENLSDEEAQQMEQIFEQYYATVEHYDETFKTLRHETHFATTEDGKVWRDKKRNLLSIWQTTLERHKDNLLPLEQHLIDNMESIERALFGIRFYSKQSDFNNSFAELGIIFNEGAMDGEQAQAMNDMSEMNSYDVSDEVYEEELPFAVG